MATLPTRLQAQASAITTSTLIHIVVTGDTSQSPDGSSYKATLGQLTSLFGGNTDLYITGGTYSAGTLTLTNLTGGTISVSGFTEPFSGGSGNCIADLYVSNIHSCSPLNINPLDEGNVYFGSTSGITIDVLNNRLGINNPNPTELLHTKDGDILIENTSGKFLTDIQNSVGPLVFISGGTNDLPRIGAITPSSDSITMGVRGSSDVSYPGYGNQGDSFIYSSNPNNGINIISSQGTGTDDYIRFYAGQNANGTTPDLYIQGSGSTRGYVGIGTETPTEKLHIEGGDILIENGNSNVSTDLDSTIRRLIVTTTSSTGLTELVTSVDYPSLGGFGGVLLGTIGENAVLGGIVPERGKQGDSYLYAGARVNGLNIINKENPSSTEDYIRFFAGQDAVGTADIHIQGSGSTRGFVGIGTETPTEKLEVNGKAKTINFQMTSGATNGYVLTSDASGNASWQASSGGVSIDPYNNLGNVNTITWDVSGNSTNYQATLTGNTILVLTNVRNGDYGTIILTQDGVGGRTIALGNINGSVGTHRVVNGGGGSVVLTSNPNAIDILTFTYNGSVMYWTVGNDYT